MANNFKSYKNLTIIFGVLFIISLIGNVYLFSSRVTVTNNNDEVENPNQDEYKEITVKHFEMKEIKPNQYEVEGHSLEYGEQITYILENDKKLSLKKGDNVEFRMEIDTDTTKPVTLGYYSKDEYVDFFTQDVEDEAAVMWVVPEDGEYAFYSEGIAPENTIIKNISIKISSNQKKGKVEKFTHDPINYAELHKKNIEMTVDSNGYGVGKHTINEGGLITYTQKNDQKISLEKDQVIHIEIGLEDDAAEDIVFGYINNGEYTEMLSGRITKMGKLTWIVSEDGEYAFYCIGMAGETEIKNISIQD